MIIQAIETEIADMLIHSIISVLHKNVLTYNRDSNHDEKNLI